MTHYLSNYNAASESELPPSGISEPPVIDADLDGLFKNSGVSDIPADGDEMGTVSLKRKNEQEISKRAQSQRISERNLHTMDFVQEHMEAITAHHRT